MRNNEVRKIGALQTRAGAEAGAGEDGSGKCNNSSNYRADKLSFVTVTQYLIMLHTMSQCCTQYYIVIHNVILLHKMSKCYNQCHSVTNNVTHSVKIVFTILRTMILCFTQCELGNIRIGCYL